MSPCAWYPPWKPPEPGHPRHRFPLVPARQYKCPKKSVAAAFALAWRFADDPQSALFVAVNLGGDTDTIAAMTGAMTGACTGPEVFDPALCSQVASVSHLDLQKTARGLITLR